LAKVNIPAQSGTRPARRWIDLPPISGRRRHLHHIWDDWNQRHCDKADVSASASCLVRRRPNDSPISVRGLGIETEREKVREIGMMWTEKKYSRKA
jgi:hypothetical protein